MARREVSNNDRSQCSSFPAALEFKAGMPFGKSSKFKVESSKFKTAQLTYERHERESDVCKLQVAIVHRFRGVDGTDRQTDRQTDKQTDRQTDKQTDRQTDKQCFVLYIILRCIWRMQKIMLISLIVHGWNDGWVNGSLMLLSD